MLRYCIGIRLIQCSYHYLAGKNSERFPCGNTWIWIVINRPSPGSVSLPREFAFQGDLVIGALTACLATAIEVLSGLRKMQGVFDPYRIKLLFPCPKRLVDFLEKTLAVLCLAECTMISVGTLKNKQSTRAGQDPGYRPSSAAFHDFPQPGRDRA